MFDWFTRFDKRYPKLYASVPTQRRGLRKIFEVVLYSLKRHTKLRLQDMRYESAFLWIMKVTSIAKYKKCKNKIILHAIAVYFFSAVLATIIPTLLKKPTPLFIHLLH